jgi:hypothetical protein
MADSLLFIEILAQLFYASTKTLLASLASVEPVKPLLFLPV